MFRSLRLPFEHRFQRIDLGTYGPRSLSGYVRHAGVRLEWAGRRFALSRARATHLEVTEGGRRSVLEVPTPRDPWLLLLAGTLVLLLASALATSVAQRGGRR